MQIAYRDIRNVSVFLYGRLAQLVETTDDTKKIQNEILILENLRPVSLMVELRLYTAVTAVRFCHGLPNFSYQICQRDLEVREVLYTF